MKVILIDTKNVIDKKTKYEKCKKNKKQKSVKKCENQNRVCPNAHPDMFYQIREHGEKAGKTLSLQQQQQFVLFAVITLSFFVFL